MIKGDAEFSHKKNNLNSSYLNNKENVAKFPVFASFNNCDARMKFLGAWRPILRNMIELKRRLDDISRDKIIRNIISNHKDMVDIILEIFGITTGLEKDKIADEKEKNRILREDKGELEKQVENLSEKDPIGFLKR
jgi:DNA-directed RNA polymerase beta' subunit